MAKIRGFKPDLWTDDDFVEVTPLARLLWMGMWSFACDNGHVPNKPRQLKMRVLPADDCSLSVLTCELADQGLIVVEDAWLTVPNLRKHQQADKRYLVGCDYPGCRESVEAERKSRRAHDEATTSAPSAPPVASQRPHDDGDGDGDGEELHTVDSIDPAPAPKLVQTPSRFEEFWAAMPKRGEHANPKKPAKVKFDRIAKTTNPDVLIAAAAAYARTRDGQDPQHTAQAVTWLSQERWADQLEAPKPAERTGSFSPPPLPAGAPGGLFRFWNRAHSEAWRAGRPGPSDWRELPEARDAS